MDQTREALFNVLANSVNFEDQIVLDAFGGTGSISLEFISRGTAKVCLVEKHSPCISYLKKIVAQLGIATNLELIRGDVYKFIKNTEQRFTLIFMDPPYDYPYYQNLVDLVFEKKLLTHDGLLIMEHNSETDFSHHQSFTESRKYGETYFSFFRA
jgi:16S rRNA (guanine(966)-N(2))-methyltransferase RsmD